MDQSPVRTYCATCKTKTKHDVTHEVHDHFTPENTPGMQIDVWNDTFQIVRCKGCDARSFRHVSSSSEDFNYDTNDFDETVREYPGEPPPENRSFEARSAKAFRHVPEGPKRIYGETVDAYNRELYTLAGGGVRAIIEAICAEKGVTDGPYEVTDITTGAVVTKRAGDLRGKIGGLAERNILTKQHAEVLHEHRFLGNKALHELRTPSYDELDIAIDIIEHTLENIYEVAHKAAKLTKARTT